jgi:hypothetical protein
VERSALVLLDHALAKIVPTRSIKGSLPARKSAVVNPNICSARLIR